MKRWATHLVFFYQFSAAQLTESNLVEVTHGVGKLVKYHSHAAKAAICKHDECNTLLPLSLISMMERHN